MKEILCMFYDCETTGYSDLVYGLYIWLNDVYMYVYFQGDF